MIAHFLPGEPRPIPYCSECNRSLRDRKAWICVRQVLCVNCFDQYRIQFGTKIKHQIEKLLSNHDDPMKTKGIYSNLELKQATETI